MIEIRALFKRTEHWEARDPYPARHLLHLVTAETGDDLRLDATPEVAREAEAVPLLTPLHVSCVVIRTERNGAVKLRAERLITGKKDA